MSACAVFERDWPRGESVFDLLQAADMEPGLCVPSPDGPKLCGSLEIVACGPWQLRRILFGNDDRWRMALASSLRETL